MERLARLPARDERLSHRPAPDNYILIPRLIGQRIGLHPLMVIFALLGFGQLSGFAGFLLALPAAAVLLVALRRGRAAYLESPIYRAR